MRFALSNNMNIQKSLVIIPTYNELENLPRLIPAVLSQDESINILIVDDGS
ncbi:MAG TPA: glycosyltransferase, partial [Ignavibacteriaceae bacterium]